MGPRSKQLKAMGVKNMDEINRPKFIMMVGVPGSGKSTISNDISCCENAVVISSDGIREELYGDPSIQGEASDVFALMHNRVKEYLNLGYSVIYDATNMSRRDRKSALSIVPEYVIKECYVVWASIETCIKRDSMRTRTVGEDVIHKMLHRFEAPFYDEGFDKIEIIINEDGWFDAVKYTQDCVNAMKIPHDNKHHSLPIFEHCVSARDYACSKNFDQIVINAALFHDIGKPITKKFETYNGEPSEDAHYYQHQNVGAWMSYGISARPEMAWMISTHMDPFFDTKYYKRLPKYLKDYIDKLHDADVNADTWTNDKIK